MEIRMLLQKGFQHIVWLAIESWLQLHRDFFPTFFQNYDIKIIELLQMAVLTPSRSTFEEIVLIYYEKNCSSYSEKNLRLLEQFIQKVEGQNNCWNRIIF